MEALTQVPAVLGRVSAQAGVLVVLVLLAQWLFRRHLTPRWRCALWGLVMLRLLLPVSLSSSASIFNVAPRFSERASDLAGVVAVSQSTLPTRPVSAERGASNTDGPSVVESNLRTTGPIAVTAPSDQASPAGPVPGRLSGTRTKMTRSGITRSIPWAEVAIVIWFAGFLALVARVAFCSVRLNRQIRPARPVIEPEALATLEQCRVELRVRARLPLVESASIDSPALYGFLKPRLVLPAGFLATYARSELRFVFLHELAHVKRRDVLVNWIVTFLQVVHWFNPLVWFGFARWRMDRELACDALALEIAGAKHNKDYGRAILHLLEGSTQRAAAPALVGILEDQRQLRRRIGMIASFRPPGRWAWLAVALVAILGLVGLTDAKGKSGRADDLPGRAVVSAPRGSNEPNAAAELTDRASVTSGPAMKVTVVADEDGQPLRDAEVLAPNSGSFFGGPGNGPRWRTDDSGVAMIHVGEVPSEPTKQMTWFTISIRRVGYAPRGLSWSVEKSDARLGMPKEVTVRLQRGFVLGGLVQDESGKPLEGVRVRVFGTAYSVEKWRVHQQEYPEFWSGPKESPAAITGSEGRWQVADFPGDLDNVAIEFILPDGPVQTFLHSSPGNYSLGNSGGEPFRLEEARQGRAVFVLKSGYTVRGIVLAPDGEPLPGVLVKEGFGAVNRKSVGDFRSGADGRFELRNRPARQMILTACPENLATTSVIVDVGPGTPVVRLQTTPLSPLRMRTVDAEGAPLGGTIVTVDSHRTEGQMLDFRGVAGDEGALVWTNAPLAPMTLVADSPALKVRRKFRLEVGQRDVTVTLRKGMGMELFVRAKVRDATTGEPVRVESAGFQTADREGFGTVETIGKSEFVLSVPASRFRQGMYPSYQIQLQAAGYETLLTDWRDFDEGDWEVELKMRKGDKPSGQLVLADGAPAAGAEIAIITGEHSTLFMNLPGRINPGQEPYVRRTRADAQGRFAFAHPGADRLVLVTHEQGFLESSVNKLRDGKPIQLLPWGRVEGVVLAHHQPQPHARVTISGGSPGLGGWQFFLITNADSQGRFVLEKVPPGLCLLSRNFEKRPGPITSGYQMPLEVKAGEVTRVDYGGAGRTVLGRVEGEADWSNDTQVLVLKQPSPRPHPRLEDFATTAAFEKARDAYDATDRRRQQFAERVYQLQFESDSSFRIDDVPPGAYELLIRVTEPPRNDEERYNMMRQSKVLASLTREVTVPDSVSGNNDEPLDLGALPLEWKNPPATTPGIDFRAQTLEGKPFSLADYRGKYVLLAFWAAWSDRSEEQLGEVKKLFDNLGADQRVIFIGVSLDDDLDSVRQTVVRRGYRWTQTRLEGAQRAAVTAALGVDVLPDLVLLNREGRIAGRELEGDRLRLALQRALKK